MLHALSTGTGDGSLNVEVDGYGSFGGAVFATFNGAVYDPIGPILPAETTFESGVAVRFGGSGTRQYLTSGSILGSSSLPAPVVSGSLTNATSSFSFEGVAVELTQIAAQLFDSSNTQTGSILTQRYVMQNVGNEVLTFEIVRYFDGDLLFDGSLVDGGGRLVFASGGEFLFETDAGGSGATDTTFVGIDATGGTAPGTGRFEIDSFSQLGTRIANGDALDDQISGDLDLDGFIEAGSEYDVTLALRNVFTLSPGQSASYTTRTLFGSGTPEDVSIDDPVVSVPDVAKLEGDSGLTDFVFNVTLSKTPSTPVIVGYSTEDDGDLSGDYVPTSGTLTFLPGGPLTRTVTVQVIGDTERETNETFRLRLDATSGILERDVALGHILNDDVDLQVNDISIIEGNSGTKDAVFTISGMGAINQDIRVSYSTISQSAQGASDYLPRAGVATLTAANPTALVTVPIVGDTFNEGLETFGLQLTFAENARIEDALGIATIIDNDPTPNFYVDDVQVTTTLAGDRIATFTVALDWPSGRDVSVQYATSDGTARAGIEYQGLVGTLDFAPGARTQQVVVPVMTSDVHSANKIFYLNLLGAVNAHFGDPQGVGTIVFAAEPSGEATIDNGAAGYTTLGGWSTLTNTLAHQLDYDYHAAGNGSAAATWTFAALPAGQYQVFTRWIPFSNRATNAPFTIYDVNTPLATIPVNQQLEPTGEMSNGISWQSLGTFTIGGNTLRVRLTDNANGYVTADAVRLVAGGIAGQEPEMDVSSLDRSIDTGDTTPAFDDGTHFGQAALFTDSLVHTFTIRNNGNAVLHLTGNPPVIIGGAHKSDFHIVSQPATTLGPGKKTTFQVLFRPSGEGPRQATIAIANDDDSEDPYLIAIEGVGTGASPSQVTIDNGAANFAQVGSWTSGDNAQAFHGDMLTSTAGAGGTFARWQFAGLSPGNYFVFTTWAPSASLATNAPYLVSNGVGGDMTLLVNQQIAPGLLISGRHWASLGAVQVAAGMLTVDLKNEGNGPVAADAVMILREGAVPEAGPLAHNAAFPQDVNDDGRVSTGDVLVVVNTLLRAASPLAATTQTASQQYYVDVSGDGRVSTNDVLMVVNYLLRQAATPQAAVAEPAASVEQSFVLFDDTGDASASSATSREEDGSLVDVAPPLVSRLETPLLTPVGVEAFFAEGDSADEELIDVDLEFDLLAPEA